MSVYKQINIKSKINNYSVLFVNDFQHDLQIGGKEKLFFIIDSRVKKLYQGKINSLIRKHPSMTLKASERIKTIDNAKVIIKHLIEKDIKKDFILIAVGGGTIQDITAFVASVLYRGVEWIFVPTTLLAQCDSCIGSKTSINVDEYKNQVGNFYPPTRIILDVNFLKTLTQSEVKSGLGEIIKVHLLDSKKSARSIIKNYETALTYPEAMSKLIFRSLMIKKRIIERDEFDTGFRNIMNYGHTFGHALESLTEYNLNHGQSVTIGMDISNYLSYKLKYITKSRYEDMKNILLGNWPDYNFKNLDLDVFFEYLAKDKKNTGSKVTMILTRGYGKMLKKSLLINGRIKDFILHYFSRELKNGNQK